MKRRDVLKGAALAGAAGAVGAAALPAPALAQRRKRLRMVTTWPKNFPGLGTAPEQFARIVKEMTDGQIDIRVYAAGELAPAFEAFDAVEQGAADMYHGVEYYWQGKNKAFSFFTAVPFGLTATEMQAWLHHQGGQELWDKVAEPFGIKPLPCGNTGCQAGGWFNREIATVEDLRGLNIRIPGLGGEVMRRLGANAVALPGGEIFQALQQNTIDATEWVGPWNDLAFGFHRAAKYYYLPGFHEPGAQLSLGINKAVWDDFTPAQKTILTQAGNAVTNTNLAEFNARNAGALDTLIEEHGVEVRSFSDDIYKAAAEASNAVLEEVAAENTLTRDVYESFKAARGTATTWGRYSDEGYAQARRLAYTG